MVKFRPADEQLDTVFAALANAKRRAIVARLTEGEASMTELAEPLGATLPALTKHLAVLERAGLLEHHKAGRVRRCRLNPTPIGVAEGWLRDYRAFWEPRLDSLGDHFKSIKEGR